MVADYFKAKEYFGKACDMGDQFACENYADLNSKGY
ncbi:Sel1 repeat protein [Campylobacter fetus subsp. venerealis]|nr:Sel1 repeat protein [Campylobacter fetus]QQF52178.1 Sel1 repeat protein [Campylobacter fetus subsp. venerealis]